MNELTTTEAYLPATTILPHLELTPGMLVGDFGVGGAAHFAVPVAQAVGPEGGVIMFDIMKSSLSAAMSEIKRRGLTNCKFVWSNLEIYGGAQGVKDECFDAGLLMNVLFQSNKFKDILAEVHRMLKPNAKLLIVDWLPEADISFAPAKDRRLPVALVEQIAKPLGYAPLKRFEAGPYHWGLVLVKI